jgi:ribonuclease-3
MDALQTRIGYRFRDGGLLALALTHPSVLKQQSNQRLEFLGDAVLGAIVAHVLYGMYPHEQEGELAMRQAALVRGSTLTQVARDIELGEALTLGLSEVQSQGRANPSNLEDALEALVGALYLDGGMAVAEAFVLPRWKAMAEKVEIAPKDAKTALQEWAQARGLPVPAYRLVGSAGPAHAPQFTIEVAVQGQPPAQAMAAAKRMAEQLAASILLKKLNNIT